MEYVVSGYEPAGLFRYFEDLCAIPHSSGNEGGIADYLEAFARRQGLPATRDALNNVIIRKAAASGCENAPTLILQAHTDMVCVKAPGSNHDFDRDGLRLQVAEGDLRAAGTSLGADDGIGVALILQLLSEDNLRHPPLECLFTTQEETGMEGVSGIDVSGLRGRMLVNLDGADEALITAGSAGGARLLLQKPIETQAAAGHGMDISISGLLSGHSGEDIHRGRANAIKLMARLLRYVSAKTRFCLATLEGGSKTNAIPAECAATVVFETEAAWQAASAAVQEAAKDFPAEYSVETSLSVTCRPAQCPARMLSEADSIDLLEFLQALPVGPLARNPLLDDVVISSNNLATTAITAEEIQIYCMCRAALPSLQKDNEDVIRILCKHFGFTFTVDNEYGCWAFAEHSPLREHYSACAREVLGFNPKPVLLHAGLESAFFIQRIPGLDVITVGPEMSGLHSTQERLGLASCGRIFQILRRLLERLALENQ